MLTDGKIYLLIILGGMLLFIVSAVLFIPINIIRKNTERINASQFNLRVSLFIGELCGVGALIGMGAIIAGIISSVVFLISR